MARILIVDDEVKIVRLLAGLLEPHGFDVLTALHGEEALVLLAMHRPEVLLLDLHLGGQGMSGLDVLREARTVSAATRVIVVSAYPQETTREDTLRLGAFRYLEKPLDVRAVLSVVRETLTPHRS